MSIEGRTFLTLLYQARIADAKQAAETRRILDAAVERGRQANAQELAEAKARTASLERHAQQSTKEMAALRRELNATRAAQGSRSQISVSFQIFTFPTFRHLLIHSNQSRYNLKCCKPRSKWAAHPLEGSSWRPSSTYRKPDFHHAYYMCFWAIFTDFSTANFCSVYYFLTIQTS